MAAPNDSQELNSYDQADATDDDQGIFSDASDSNIIKRDSLRKFALIDGTANAYSAAKTYKPGNLVTEANVTYRNIVEITVPEGFTPAKWKDIDGPTVPAEIEAQAALGLISDQVVAASDAITWDENFFIGDATKIVDEGSGIIRLHNGVFALASTLALNIGGGGSQSAVLAWESSANVGGPFTAIPNPNARAAAYTIGNSSVTTQPLATAVVDATGADVFVRAVLTTSVSTTILNAASSATITSFGTSAVANTPLANAGDLLTHNGTSEQVLPKGTNGQRLEVDDAESNKLKWVTPAAGGASAQSYIVIHTPEGTLYSIVQTSSSVAKIIPASNYILDENTTDFEIDNAESDGHDRIKYTGATTKKFMVQWKTAIRNLSANTHYFGMIQKNSTGASAGTQIAAAYSIYFAMPNTDSYFPLSGFAIVELAQNDKINFASGQEGGTLNHFNRDITVSLVEIL